jgi:peptidoglycan/xylan/chitin deacetylase (PgdA/CDA1 family)
VNIIHLLSQTHLTGAEVYAASLAAEQLRAGHRVYQVSNGFFYETAAIKMAKPVETKSNLEFWRNVFWLRNYLKTQQVHVIHSHSRAAAKLAFYATLFNETAHVSSVHGKQHSSISKKLFSKYGQFIIAVCKNVKTHLVQDYGYNEKRIKVIPNPIDTAAFSFVKREQNSSDPVKIAIVGRATGPKAERTNQILNALFSGKVKTSNLKVFVVGAELSQLNVAKEIKSQLQEVQIPRLDSKAYAAYDIVVGSGRVCMESLISGVPTIAFGEACYCGPVTEQNFETAFGSNFGDIHPESEHPNLDKPQFIKDLTALLQNRASDNSGLKKLSDLATRTFSVDRISRKVLRVYESAYFLKNYSQWIPTLMYHKIPLTAPDSRHKIYVTADNFEKHLKTFKTLGFTTLTFSELSLYRKGLVSFKNFPKKPLLLTFDDGYRDNLEIASPLLKKYGYRAQLFLLADKNISSNVWDQTQDEPPHEIIAGNERLKWKESAFEVGSHGFSHQKITDFSDRESALQELAESKQALEKEFNSPVTAYAFTYGTTTSDSAELAEEAGYEYAVNTDTGGLLAEEDPFAIFRVNIFPEENFWSLYKKTSKWYRKYYYWKRQK